MRAKVLYIISYGYDKEIPDVCAGLISKYRKRCGKIVRYDISYKKSELIPGDTPDAGDIEVGVYLVFHSMGMDGGQNTPPPDQMIDVMGQIMNGDLKKTEKVVFLACALAGGKSKEDKQFLKDKVHNKPVDHFYKVESKTEYDLWEGKDVVKDTKVLDKGKAIGYLLTFLMLLEGKGVTPRVAGYDDYISVLPSREGNAAILSSTGPAAFNPALSDGQLKDRAGSKVGRKQERYGLAHPPEKTNKTGGTGSSYSDVHKRTFYVKSGTVYVSDGSGWSYD
ncbi:MAG: hypothetical protein JWO38_8270 [Gemmataceae bacterium]|nr:hypothetical protein [Gemmataceae bacterium]